MKPFVVQRPERPMNFTTLGDNGISTLNFREKSK
jgi:hypothetical protein